MRIVLDTNVLLSGVVFGGIPDRVILAIKKKKYRVITSPFILGELRKHLRDKIGWENFRIEYAIRNLGRISEVIEPKKKVGRIKTDKSDNNILACAVEGKADYIVSGDKKHLLSLKKFRGIPIYSPQEFLKKVLYD
jgi:putative PIN family toxin of toxin-antitoxin system